MKMGERLAWMAAKNQTTGSGTSAVAETIAVAEEYVSRYPLDGHGFSTSAEIELASKSAALAMLAEAGYAWSGARGSRVCARGGFRAEVTVSRYGTVTVFINPTAGMTALAAGSNGYLSRDDRPDA